MEVKFKNGEGRKWRRVLVLSLLLQLTIYTFFFNFIDFILIFLKLFGHVEERGIKKRVN